MGRKEYVIALSIMSLSVITIFSIYATAEEESSPLHFLTVMFPNGDEWTMEIESSTLEGPSPSTIEIGQDCLRTFGDKNDPSDHGTMKYTVTVQNFDSVPHSASLEIVDMLDNGNIVSSKVIQVENLEPDEVKTYTETIKLKQISGYLCIVNLLNVN